MSGNDSFGRVPVYVEGGGLFGQAVKFGLAYETGRTVDHEILERCNIPSSSKAYKIIPSDGVKVLQIAKGHAEGGETPEQAATREALEEIGYDSDSTPHEDLGSVERMVQGKRGTYNLTTFIDRVQGRRGISLDERHVETDRRVWSDHQFSQGGEWASLEEVGKAIGIYEKLLELPEIQEQSELADMIRGDIKSIGSQLQVLQEIEGMAKKPKSRPKELG